VNRLVQVNPGQQGRYFDVQDMGKIEQAEIGDIDGAAFNFGNAASGNQPAGALQFVGQFLLSQVPLVAQSADLSSHHIKRIHNAFL